MTRPALDIARSDARGIEGTDAECAIEPVSTLYLTSCSLDPVKGEIYMFASKHAFVRVTPRLTILSRFQALLTALLKDLSPLRTHLRMSHSMARGLSNAWPRQARSDAFRESGTFTSSRPKQGITLIMLAGLIGPAAVSAQTLVVPGVIPKVFVDVKHCEWTSTLCSGSGSVGPAANGNASIVAIYYQGTTSSLSESSFTLSSVTNPGGVTPAFVSSATCAACFAEPEPGVYRLAARPAFGNWAGGTYVVLLTVTRPTGGSVTVMVPIDIPF